MKKLFICLAFVILSSCQKRLDEPVYGKVEIDFSESVSAADTEPTSLSEVNCIGAFITYLGPGNRGECTTSTGRVFQAGDSGGLASFNSANAGQVVVERVLLGVPFIVELVGFNSNGAACAVLGANFNPTNLGYSLGYTLGRSTQRIIESSTNNPLSLDASFDSSSYITSCSSLIFQSGDTANSLCIGVSSSETNHLAKTTNTGTYILCTPGQLNSLATASPDWGNSYILGKDIDLSSFSNFTPIATGSAFTGSFNGAAKSITNLTQTGDTAGLFHALNGANVRNLKLSVAINSACAAAGNIGGLVSKIDNSAAASTIENIKLTGTIDCTGSSGIPVGGLIGSLSGQSSTTIQRIKSEVNINYSPMPGGSYAGGVVGKIVNSTGGAYQTIIKETAYTGTLLSNAQYSGGIIGYANFNPGTGTPSLTIVDSYFSGTIGSLTDGVATSMGGFAGNLIDDNFGVISLSRIYASGTVGPAANKPDDAGGLFGAVTNIQIIDSFSAITDINIDTGSTGFITVTNNGATGGNIVYFSGTTCSTACGSLLGNTPQASLSYFYTITNAPLSNWTFGPTQPWAGTNNGSALPVLVFEAALQ